MTSIKLGLFALIFAALLGSAAFGQTGTPPSTPGKVGLINIGAFGDTTKGITKYKNGLDAVDKSLEQVNAELRSLATKYNTGLTEYQAMQKAVPPPPAAQLQAKADELQLLQTNIKRKQEDGKALYDKNYSDIMSPITNDIIRALNEYARQKGYAVILDGAKLEQANILWGFDDKYDVTKDFIAFYNTRPPANSTVPAKPN